MALIVENGSIVVGAESYVTVVEADTYWTDRNNQDWDDAADEAKEAALREAQQFLDATYDWIGTRVLATQELDWPRWVIYDRERRAILHNEIPKYVKQAQMELALQALSGRLLDSQERAGMVLSETVGPLAVTYSQGAPGGRTYPFVDALVSGLINGKSVGGYSGTAVRA